jgi:hypothetical protein
MEASWDGRNGKVILKRKFVFQFRLSVLSFLIRIERHKHNFQLLTSLSLTDESKEGERAHSVAKNRDPQLSHVD